MHAFRLGWVNSLVMVAVALLPSACWGADGALPFISASGAQFVNSRREPVILKGCNLGNYLMLESWMWGGTMGSGRGHLFRDGATFYRMLRERFGAERAGKLIELYRENWITPRDFELIKSFGFNVVRLPFDYRLVQEDQKPFAIKLDAFRWLDHAVEKARAANVYVILDLHGTPGGQSLEDHTGEAGQDHLWKSEEDQQRTIEVWRAVAAHFKDESTVAAYDLVNEPYGNHTEDCRPVLARLMPEIYKAIRSTGDQHVVFFSGALNGGIAFYGNPHESGMTNVAFTEHFYPGLFGSTAALETQARVLNQEMPSKHDYLDAIASPYYIGEFNVVLSAEDPGRLMRAYYDRFAEYGWAGTMWAYKLISANGGVGADTWCMVTNADPLPSIDLRNSSYDEFEKFFANLATMPLAVNERLRSALTAETAPPLYLAQFPKLAAAAPKDPPAMDPQGYSSIDIGGATPGYTRAMKGGNVEVMGGGQDIFGAHDACRFVSRPEAGDSTDVKATILSFVDSAEHAKAGVMARWGEADHPDAAMAMVNLFPGGTIAFVTRPHAGAAATETKIAAGVQTPVELRLQISAGRVTAMYRTNSGDWQTVGSADEPREGALRTGLAVCSHLDAALTTVKARLGPAADEGLPAPGNERDHASSGPSLLVNGSFEEQGSAGDLAAGWDRLGPWINRETGWSPTHSGVCEIGYHHWQVESADSSCLWQDVNAEPGKRYTFSIFAQRDVPEAAKAEAKNVELRLESTMPDGQLTLNSKTFEVDQLPSGKNWRWLSISGTAAGTKLRVLVLITPAADSPRGGAIKLDDAGLTAADGNESDKVVGHN